MAGVSFFTLSDRFLPEVIVKKGVEKARSCSQCGDLGHCRQAADR